MQNKLVREKDASVVDQYKTTLNSLAETPMHRINGVVVTWVVAIDPPGVRFPLNALCSFAL